MLNNIIPAQNYELIREAIGRVLTTGLAEQDTLIDAWNTEHENDNGFVAKTKLGVSIFLERTAPFDKAELPAINIIYIESQQDAENTAFTTVFNNSYLIEVYTNAEATAGADAGYLSATQMAKITGIIRAILMNRINLYLDFTDKFIQTRYIKTIARTAPRIKNDALSTISGTIEAHYIAEETTELGAGVPIGELETVVKLSTTEKGYKFIIEKPS